MKCVRVGLIGFGFAGRVFQSNVIEAVEGLELAAIVQRSGSEAAAAFPRARIVPSVDALLEDASIHLVVVATPNASHLPIARQCLLAGRHVVIDKPFALSSEEAAELIQLARERQRLLSVYQNRRWDGDFLTVRKLLDGDILGRLVQFESHYDRFRQAPRLHAWRRTVPPAAVSFLTWEHTWWTRHSCSLVFLNLSGRVYGWSGRERGRMMPSTSICTTRA